MRNYRTLGQMCSYYVGTLMAMSEAQGTVCVATELNLGLGHG